MIKVPPISTPVLWYEHADRKSKPAAAVVLDSFPNGALRVGVFPKQGGDIIVKVSVYHVSNPILFDDNGAPTIGAIRNGGWDYNPWMLGVAESASKEDPSIPKDLSEKVLELAMDNDFDTVCKKVRSLGLNRAAVAKIYESK